MASIASAIPILPGKLEAWRQFVAEMHGPRRMEHAASRRRLGITTERAYLQQTPQGEFAVVFFEAPDVGQMMQGFATSQEPFDIWFREQVLDVHGWDMTQPPPGPLPELVIDWQQE